MSLAGTDEWLAGHGIDDPEIWAERESWRYEKGDVDRVLSAVGPFLKHGWVKGWVRKVVDAGPGLVMPKTPVPGLPDIAPQLRPDGAVAVDPRPGPYHFHAWLGPDDPWPTTPVKTETDDWGRPLGGRPLPGKLVWNPENIYVRAHVAKDHDDVEGDPLGVHRHPAEAGKYLFLPGTAQARIDLHPRAAALIADAERVFFVLEGALKNDAVLSAGEAVFSVPSVTLWRTRAERRRGYAAKELQDFARKYLRGKTVFVVPDADWVGNPAVDLNALLVRTYLREVLGRSVYIAAPPVGFYEHHKGRGDDTQKGIDDWLGPKGREYAAAYGVPAGIDGLEIRGKEAGEKVAVWPREYDVKTSHVSPAKDRHALTMLSLLGPRYALSLGGLASVMDVTGEGHPERAVPFLKRLASRGAIEITGSLDWGTFVRVTGKTKKPMTQKDWVDPKERPMIELQEGFVAHGTPRTLLGDFWDRDNRAMIRELQAETAENTRRLREVEERLGLSAPDEDGEARHLRRVQ